MQATGLFEQALGLERPWYVERTEFDAGERRLATAEEAAATNSGHIHVLGNRPIHLFLTGLALPAHALYPCLGVCTRRSW